MLYKRSFIMVTVVILVSAVILSVYSASAVCPDGITLNSTKEFKGDVASIVGNVTISNFMVPHTVYFNGPLPANDIIFISGLNDPTTVSISWTDWRGAQTESHFVCENGNDYLCNVIPYPKSGQMAVELSVMLALASHLKIVSL